MGGNVLRKTVVFSNALYGMFERERRMCDHLSTKMELIVRAEKKDNSRADMHIIYRQGQLQYTERSGRSVAELRR